jgi:hypothetical protein
MARDMATIHPRATIAWDVLRSQRKTSQAALRSLSAIPRERWPEHGVQILNPEESLYRLHIPPEYAVIFSAADSGPFVIEDIMNERVLEQLRPAK